MLPDVPAIDKVFDYLVPPALDGAVRLGTIVRIELHGRRVGGWVVREGGAEGDRSLRPIAKVTGWGPPDDVLDVSLWAARRWAGRRASFLSTASPSPSVRGLPTAPVVAAVERPAVDGPLIRRALQPGPAARRLLRLPPTTDPFPLVLAAASSGPALVLTPSVDDAASLASRLRHAGIATALHPREWAAARAGGTTVVGSRAAAWAPMPKIEVVVVLDAHDEAYQEERAPTWHAREVAVERARHAGVPAVLVSPCPDLVLLDQADELLVMDRPKERSGWPPLDVVDRRLDDPRTGLFGERVTERLRRSDRAVCVINRKGRARLLACAACGELARCERCDAALAQVHDVLSCGRCSLDRPPVCAECGERGSRRFGSG